MSKFRSICCAIAIGFGKDFTKQVLSAPRAPWQRVYIELVIGSIRRECLDHVIVFNEGSLYRHVQSFVDYYHESRTHLSLEKDTPGRRPVQPPESGQVIALPQRRKPIMLGSLLVEGSRLARSTPGHVIVG